jgi:hypothetical protein
MSKQSFLLRGKKWMLLLLHILNFIVDGKLKISNRDDTSTQQNHHMLLSVGGSASFGKMDPTK